MNIVQIEYLICDNIHPDIVLKLLYGGESYPYLYFKNQYWVNAYKLNAAAPK